MTSGSDDLEQEVRRNLKLKRELGAKAAKGKAALSAKQGGGIAYRLGWVLYWACLALIGLWLVWCAFEFVAHINNPYRMFLSEEVYSGHVLWVLGLVGVPPLALYGLGRAFRYVLSGE